LNEGDLIVFPQGDAHVMTSAPGLRGQHDIAQYQLPTGTSLPISIRQGGGGERTALICGFFGCDARPFNPLLATLPRTLLVRNERLSAPPFATDARSAVLSPLVQLALSESKLRRSGSDCVLSRVSELLFVEAIRLYVETLAPEQSGWFAGLRDEHVGKALAALHGRPAKAWSLEGLALEVGLSRSLLAERFVHFVGLPPMQYLANWRMQLASQRLRTTSEGLAEVAEHVGYGSESAFSRAFKRLVGVPPAAFRQGSAGLSRP
jgi:AraC-like DNA-binding protein